MTLTFRIPTIRKIATGVLLAITLGFVAFLAYLWLAFGDMLGENVEVGAGRKLLTNFDTSKFDDAVERLEKRRTLSDPPQDLRDPFGTVPR